MNRRVATVTAAIWLFGFCWGYAAHSFWNAGAWLSGLLAVISGVLCVLGGTVIGARSALRRAAAVLGGFPKSIPIGRCAKCGEFHPFPEQSPAASREDLH